MSSLVVSFPTATKNQTMASPIPSSTPSFISSIPLRRLPRHRTLNCSQCPHQPHIQKYPLRTLMTCAPVPKRQYDDIDNSKPASPSLPFNSNSFTQLALLEIGAGNFESAIAHLEAYLSDYPDDSRAWLQLVKLVKKTSGATPAIEALQKAISAISNCPFLWHYYSDLVLSTFGLNRARQTLRLANQNCPNNAVLLRFAAEVEGKLSNYQHAIPLFESATIADPTDPILYLKWAEIEQSRRKFDRARIIYQKALSNVPRRSLSILFTAYAGFEAKGRKYEVSRNLYRLAAEHDSYDPLIWHAWACMEEKAKDLDRSRELFERSILADPTFTESWQSWGLLEQRNGNFDAARTLFERGTKADPNNPFCWQSWASLEAEKGNIVEARRLFAEGAQRVKDDAPAAPLFLVWGRTEQAVGDYELARLRFNTALERKHESLSDRIILIHSLAGLEQRVGNFDTARKLYKEICTLSRRDYRSMYSWAKLELQHNNQEEAYKLLKSCVRIVPRDPRCVEQLAKLECELYSECGGVPRARSILKRAVGYNYRNQTLLKFWISLEHKYGSKVYADKLSTNVSNSNRRREQVASQK